MLSGATTANGRFLIRNRVSSLVFCYPTLVLNDAPGKLTPLAGRRPGYRGANARVPPDAGRRSGTSRRRYQRRRSTKTGHRRVDARRVSSSALALDRGYDLCALVRAPDARQTSLACSSLAIHTSSGQADCGRRRDAGPIRRRRKRRGTCPRARSARLRTGSSRPTGERGACPAWCDPTSKRGPVPTRGGTKTVAAGPGTPARRPQAGVHDIKRFTEPVALLSTRPSDLPLPRRAARLSFDLLALRARCEVQPMEHSSARQGPPPSNVALCRVLLGRASRPRRHSRPEERWPRSGRACC